MERVTRSRPVAAAAQEPAAAFRDEGDAAIGQEARVEVVPRPVGELVDIVIIDAYYADSLPFHLTTDEFFREVRERLAPQGVVAYNVISSVEGDGSDLFRSMYRTADGVWDDLWVFPIGIGEDEDAEAHRNIIVLATDADVAEEELLDRIAGRVAGRVTIAGFESFGDDLYTQVVRVGDVPLLTDSHAPTDSLIQVQ